MEIVTIKSRNREQVTQEMREAARLKDAEIFRDELASGAAAGVGAAPAVLTAGTQVEPGAVPVTTANDIQTAGEFLRLMLEGGGSGISSSWLRSVLAARQGPASQGPQQAGDAVADTGAAGAQSLDQVIAAASNRYHVPSSLVRAVIGAESDFNPNAVSPAGACGLMQLMPTTAHVLGVKDVFDPRQNVMGGTRYLRDLLDRYGNDLDRTLAAYNWGSGNVDRRFEKMPSETRRYIAEVKDRIQSAGGATV